MDICVGGSVCIVSYSVSLSPRYALTTVHDEPTGVEHVNITANVAYQLVKQRGDADACN